jgi:hypothetical protein
MKKRDIEAVAVVAATTAATQGKAAWRKLKKVGSAVAREIYDAIRAEIEEQREAIERRKYRK